MTLPASGPLSLLAINNEFNRGLNLNAYRGTVWYTDAGASGTFSSGAISFNEFYGKRPTSPTFSFSIASSQTNADLRTLAVNAGWNQSSAVVATINGGVYMSASTTGVYGLYIQGSFPGGVTLINNGAIVGAGGNGGKGGDAQEVGGPTPATAGAGGGPALYVSTGVTIQNNGTIAGGGGGGGGGSTEYYYESGPKGTSAFSLAGGGGGGGRASLAMNSSGGAAGRATTNYGYNQAVAGGTGTVNGQGAGGIGQAQSGLALQGGGGGNGGGWGAGGSAGNRGGGSGTTELYPPGGGGGGGNAIVGNGYITWTAFGTRLGGIS